jgi:hypothetical protein
MCFDRFFGLDEIVDGIDAVTSKGLQTVAREYFPPQPIAVTVLGNLDKIKISRQHLAC